MPDPVTGITTGISILGANSAKKSADKDRRAAETAEANRLAFEQTRYDDWQEIYGPLQEKLSDYYFDLSPDQYEVQGLENFEAEKAAGLKDLNERLSQRGITDSGLAAAAEIGTEMESIETRAGIRRDAPAAVASQQLGFLQVGLGQDPSAGMSRVLESTAVGARSRANDSAQVAGQAVSGALTNVGTALGDYFG